MRTISRILVIIFAPVALSSISYADGRQHPLDACKDDIHSFCSDVKPGGGRIISCLKDHSKKVSVGCSAALQKMPTSKQGSDSGKSSQKQK